MDMKRLVPIILIAVVTFSCDVVIVEQPYIDPRDKFLGHYEIDEYSQTLDWHTIYYVDVLKSGGEYGNDIFISNFYDIGVQVRAEVHGSKLVIPWQVRGRYEIEGSGVINGNRLDLVYTVHELDCCNPFTDYCDAIGWR